MNGGWPSDQLISRFFLFFLYAGDITGRGRPDCRWSQGSWLVGRRGGQEGGCGGGGGGAMWGKHRGCSGFRPARLASGGIKGKPSTLRNLSLVQLDSAPLCDLFDRAQPTHWGDPFLFAVRGPTALCWQSARCRGFCGALAVRANMVQSYCVRYGFCKLWGNTSGCRALCCHTTTRLTWFSRLDDITILHTNLYF